MKRKTKQTLKTILLSALGIGAIVGVASGINALVEKNDTELKTIHPVFEIGGLDETTGKYVKDDKTLYTKNSFECQGLEIKLDFDNYVAYEVFYYKSNGNFIESTGLIENGYTAEVPVLATHARIEITPQWDEMGEDYVEEESQIIKWYETTKYASQLEVKVNKEQVDVGEIDLYEVDKKYNGKSYASDGRLSDGATSTLEDYYNLKPISIKGASKVTIVIDQDLLDQNAVHLKYVNNDIIGANVILANLDHEVNKKDQYVFTLTEEDFAGDKLLISFFGATTIFSVFVE